MSNLFSFWAGLIAFVGSIGFASVSDWIDARPRAQAIWMSLVGFLFGAYSTINGTVHILTDWTSVNLLVPAALGGHLVGFRDGIALLLVMVWPFVCIFAGGGCAFIAYRLIQRAKKRPQ